MPVALDEFPIHQTPLSMRYVGTSDRNCYDRCYFNAHDRLEQRVGPYRIEVLEPLRRLRLICDADQHGIGFDLTWEGSFDAVDEGRHYIRQGGPRTILNTSRFAQVGSWSGVLRVDGDELGVHPDVWLGTRDRSWGIRPVGEAEHPGRLAEEPTEGFWWLYVPLRFDEFAVVVIVQ